MLSVAIVALLVLVADRFGRMRFYEIFRDRDCRRQRAKHGACLTEYAKETYYQVSKRLLIGWFTSADRCLAIADL